MPSATLKDALKTTQDVTPIVSAGGTIAGGISRLDQANAIANRYEVNAGSARAVGQRNALTTDLNTRLTLSRQRAVAAASGAGVMDPTVANIQAETGARGVTAALTDLYNGDSTANDLMLRAAFARKSGSDALGVAGFSAAKTLAAGATTLIDRYGGQLPPWMGGNSSDEFDLRNVP